MYIYINVHYRATVVANVLGCNIDVSEFELKSRY